MKTLRWSAGRRDELVGAISVDTPPSEESLCLLAEQTFLSALERIAVLSACPDYDELLKLGHGDVMHIIGRTTLRAVWNPSAHASAVGHSMDWLAAHAEHALVSPWDPGYPQRLLRLFDPPVALFARGSLERACHETGMLAMVGTRRPDQDGVQAAFQCGADAARSGFGVASGIALGIDASAHRGVLAAGRGDAAAIVLGSGIGSVYPRANRNVAADVLDTGGVIMSEYPPDTPPAKFRFPARNRIIAGLSDAVLVFQAPQGSGSLITADFALDLGLPVFIHESGSDWFGSSRLIDDSPPAARFETMRDVLEQLEDTAILIPAGARSILMGAASASDESVDPAECAPAASIDSYRMRLRAGAMR